MTRKILTSGIAGLMFLAVSACGSGDDAGDNGSATTSAPADLVVEAGPGLKFGQESYTTSAGHISLDLVNRDTQLHSLVIVDSDKKTLPGELEVGKSGDVDTGEFDLAPGTYQMLCLVPGHDNMKATLDVA